MIETLICLLIICYICYGLLVVRLTSKQNWWFTFKLAIFIFWPLFYIDVLIE